MNCSENVTSELQSVVFKIGSNSRWTVETSRKWLEDHNIKTLKKVDKSKNSLRFRIVDPKCFESFITKVVEGEMGTIYLIVGFYRKKTEGGSLSQLRKLPSSLKSKKIQSKDHMNLKKGKVHFSSKLNKKDDSKYILRIDAKHRKSLFK